MFIINLILSIGVCGEVFVKSPICPHIKPGNNMKFFCQKQVFFEDF